MARYVSWPVTYRGPLRIEGSAIFNPRISILYGECSMRTLGPNESSNDEFIQVDLQFNVFG